MTILSEQGLPSKTCLSRTFASPTRSSAAFHIHWSAVCAHSCAFARLIFEKILPEEKGLIPPAANQQSPTRTQIARRSLPSKMLPFPTQPIEITNLNQFFLEPSPFYILSTQILDFAFFASKFCGEHPSSLRVPVPPSTSPILRFRFPLAAYSSVCYHWTPLKETTVQPVPRGTRTKQHKRERSAAQMRIFCLSILTVTVLLGIACKKAAVPGAAAAAGFAVQTVVVPARAQAVSEALSLVGTIAPNESVEIKSEAEGTVEEVPFQEGEDVKAGDLLLRLDESKLAAAVAEGEANFKLSEANYERGKQLFHDKLISLQEFDQIASQYQANRASLDLRKRQLRDARILAPFKGTIGARQISPGQVISKNTSLTWLVDLDPVKVEVDVPERYLSQIALGQKIEFTVAAFPTEPFQGEVYFISPQLNPTTRTALVKARIRNPARKLKGGMFASLALRVQLRDSAIVIPEPALMSSGDTVSVFVVDDQNAAQIRPVKVGLRLAGKAEIVSGLRAGERVVVEGVQKLGPGTPVKLAPPEAAAAYLD
jgi:membrane fusion protein (multidrug efflux system)